MAKQKLETNENIEIFENILMNKFYNKFRSQKKSYIEPDNICSDGWNHLLKSEEKKKLNINYDRLIIEIKEIWGMNDLSEVLTDRSTTIAFAINISKKIIDDAFKKVNKLKSINYRRSITSAIPTMGILSATTYLGTRTPKFVVGLSFFATAAYITDFVYITISNNKIVDTILSEGHLFEIKDIAVAHFKNYDQKKSLNEYSSNTINYFYKRIKDISKDDKINNTQRIYSIQSILKKFLKIINWRDDNTEIDRNCIWLIDHRNQIIAEFEKRAKIVIKEVLSKSERNNVREQSSQDHIVDRLARDIDCKTYTALSMTCRNSSNEKNRENLKSNQAGSYAANVTNSRKTPSTQKAI